MHSNPFTKKEEKYHLFAFIIHPPLFTQLYDYTMSMLNVTLCTKEKSLRLCYQSRISKLVQLTPELESHIFVWFGGIGKYDILKGYTNELRFMCNILIEISPKKIDDFWIIQCSFNIGRLRWRYLLLYPIMIHLFEYNG